MSDMNIYQRINAVMKAVGYIKKDAKVQGYSAVTHDMVTASLRNHLIEQGIVVRVEQVSGRIVEPRNPEKGVKMHLYQADYVVSLVNMDNPEDVVSIRVQSHANDNGDKAPGKAMSYATKTALLKVFSLETGESDESRIPEDEDISEISAQLAAADNLEALQATFMLAWKSYPNSRQALVDVKDKRKKELTETAGD